MECSLHAVLQYIPFLLISEEIKPFDTFFLMYFIPFVSEISITFRMAVT